MTWWTVDIGIILAYGLQHSLLTTKVAVNAYTKLFPLWSWNIAYSALSVVTLILCFKFWQGSGIYLFQLVPGSFVFHIATITLALSLFFLFYCFKYTTSFWQWLGVRQVAAQIRREKMPDYYRVRQEGIKRYVRFPHHTCLIVLLWSHPVMTLDTLLMSIGGTIYLYVGTYHQDQRGLRLLGQSWARYRQNTALLIPGPRIIARMYRDAFKAPLSVANAVENNAPLAVNE
jgi:hypothetical protein